MEAKHNTSQSNGRQIPSADQTNPSGSDVLTTRPTHTPGEWNISSTEFRDGRMFYGIEMPTDMIGAKAYYLIAAAPDMLDALKGVAAAHGWDSEEDVRTPYAKAVMRAIAKAEAQ